MHKVEPKGATFVFSGYGYREGMIRSEIERLGASTTRHVDSATTYLVSKDDTTVEHLDARVRKIPILSDEDLQRLLAGEEVEVEEADAEEVDIFGQQSLNDLLGEVRSAAQSEPSPEQWLALVRLLDKCREEEAQFLTEYINAHTSRWSEHAMKDFIGHAADLLDPDDANNPSDKYQRYIPHLGIPGDLRVAPKQWSDQMEVKLGSPKFEIVRALYLDGKRGAAVVKVLKHPSLKNLETLYTDALMSKSLVEAICRIPTLEHLRIGEINLKTAEAFEKASNKAVCNLRVLDISRVNPPKKLKKINEIYAFTRADLFANVETLCVPNDKESLAILKFLKARDALPAVNHIHLTGNYTQPTLLKQVLDYKPYKAHLQKLSAANLFYQPKRKEDWGDLFNYDPGRRIERLDLSKFVGEDHVEKGKDRETLEMFDDLLPSSVLLEQLDELVLGAWKTDALTEKLAKTHPHLTIS